MEASHSQQQVVTTTSLHIHIQTWLQQAWTQLLGVIECDLHFTVRVGNTSGRKSPSSCGSQQSKVAPKPGGVQSIFRGAGQKQVRRQQRWQAEILYASLLTHDHQHVHFGWLSTSEQQFGLVSCGGCVKASKDLIEVFAHTCHWLRECLLELHSICRPTMRQIQTKCSACREAADSVCRDPYSRCRSDQRDPDGFFGCTRSCSC